MDVITSVHEGAKAIIQYVLDKAIEKGNLEHTVVIQDNELAAALEFKSSKLFTVCIQYLQKKELINSIGEKDARHLTLTIAGVDFLLS